MTWRDIKCYAISAFEATFFDAESGGFKRDLFEHKKGSLAIRTNQLDFDKLNSYTPNEAFLSLLNSLPEGFRFLKDGRFTQTEFKDNKCLKQVIRLIAGNWLEMYVFRVLSKELSKKNVELRTNLQITKNGWGSKARVFELDIVLFKDHILFGVSCTTANKLFLCKNKGFEIRMRTKQIGGDNAKAILITCLNKELQYALEEDLSINTEKNGKIMVLGIDDLEERILLNKIQHFVDEQ
jgi:hypothetical protein